MRWLSLLGGHVMRHIILAALLVTLSASASPAHSRRAAPLPTVAAVPDAPEGIGCYFERGRTYCARYCYVEADGNRFCRERAREAYPQAPYELIEVPILPPMK